MPRDLTRTQLATLRAAALDYCAQNGLNPTAFARKVGISQPSMRKILQAEGGASFLTAQKIALVLGSDVMALIGPAGEDEDDEPTSDAVPARAEALKRLAGVIAPAAVEYVRSLRLKTDRTWTVEDWIEEAMAAHRRARRGGLPLGARPNEDA